MADNAAFGQVGFQRITSLSSKQSLTIPSGTTHAWIQAESQDVRARFDGTDPTSTSGMVIRADDPPIEIYYDLLKNAEFIEEAASAQLSVTYFGHS